MRTACGQHEDGNAVRAITLISLDGTDCGQCGRLALNLYIEKKKKKNKSGYVRCRTWHSDIQNRRHISRPRRPRPLHANRINYLTRSTGAARVPAACCPPSANLLQICRRSAIVQKRREKKRTMVRIRNCGKVETPAQGRGFNFRGPMPAANRLGPHAWKKSPDGRWFESPPLIGSKSKADCWR
jgi:hypothetical protein